MAGSSRHQQFGIPPWHWASHWSKNCSGMGLGKLYGCRSIIIKEQTWSVHAVRDENDKATIKCNSSIQGLVTILQMRVVQTAPCWLCATAFTWALILYHVYSLFMASIIYIWHCFAVLYMDDTFSSRKPSGEKLALTINVWSYYNSTIGRSGQS